MKQFYTERDIEDLHARGVTRLEVNDNVVLTDLAREKAEALGLRLVDALTVDPAPNPPAAPATGATPVSEPADLVGRIKARVIARLGTNEYNDLLDQIIPQVLARLKGSGSVEPAAPRPADRY